MQMPTPISSTGEALRQLVSKFPCMYIFNKKPFFLLQASFPMEVQAGFRKKLFQQKYPAGSSLAAPFADWGREEPCAPTLYHRGEAASGIAQTLLPGQIPQANTRRRSRDQQNAGLLCTNRRAGQEAATEIQLVQGKEPDEQDFSPSPHHPHGAGLTQSLPTTCLHAAMLHHTQSGAFLLLPGQHLHTGSYPSAPSCRASPAPGAPHQR